MRDCRQVDFSIRQDENFQDLISSTTVGTGTRFGSSHILIRTLVLTSGLMKEGLVHPSGSPREVGVVTAVCTCNAYNG